MLIKDGETYQVIKRNSHKIIGEFTATSDMCSVMLSRLLWFKFNVKRENIYLRRKR